MTGRFWPALVLAAVVAAAAPATAQLPASGTKNFAPPNGVPNYFSNEAGAPAGSGGIVHPRMPQPSVAEEEHNRRPQRVASSNRRHPVRHAGVAKRGRHATRLAAAKAKRHATRLAAAKAKARELAAARSGSARHAAAHRQSGIPPIKAAARNHPSPPPAKGKPPPHHEG